MKRLTAIIAMSLVALSSCGAKLTMQATSPSADNDGTCALPMLYAAPAGAVRMMHFAWSGPVSGEDSVAAAAGTLATLTVTVRPGTYAIRAWASGPGGIGCDTTITRAVNAPPGRVQVQ